MKFAIFALIASVCLVSSASANIFQDWNADLMKFEKQLQGFNLGNWLNSVFDNTSEILKKLLKDVDGVDCFVKEAALVSTLSKSSVQTIKSCIQSLELTGNSDYAEIQEGIEEVEALVKLLKTFKLSTIEDFQFDKLFTIANEFLDTVKSLIENAQSLGTTVKGEEQCFKGTLDSLSNTLKGFPAKIKACANSL